MCLSSRRDSTVPLGHLSLLFHAPPSSQMSVTFPTSVDNNELLSLFWQNGTHYLYAKLRHLAPYSMLLVSHVDLKKPEYFFLNFRGTVCKV